MVLNGVGHQYCILPSLRLLDSCFLDTTLKCIHSNDGFSANQLSSLNSQEGGRRIEEFSCLSVSRQFFNCDLQRQKGGLGSTITLLF
jgi:hypothetical protein